jgi:hypothetical protein
MAVAHHLRWIGDISKAIEEGVFSVENTSGFDKDRLASHENADVKTWFLSLVDSLPSVVDGDGLVGYQEVAVNMLSNLGGKIHQATALGHLDLDSGGLEVKL